MNSKHTTETLTGGFLYSKNRLLAASGIAALLCFVLLVYPSRHVEAKKTFLDVTGAEQHEQGSLNDNLDSSLLANALSSEEHVAFDISEAALTPQVAAEPELPEGMKRIKVKSGDTLSSIFSKVGLSNASLIGILNQVPEAKRFTRLKIGQELEFKLAEDGSLDELSSSISKLQTIRLSRQADTNTYSFQTEQIETYTEQLSTSGTITSTLQAATRDAGLSYKLMLDLSNIFSSDIDFARDLRKGDSFNVVYEQKKIGDQIVGDGNILAARFTNKGKVYTAVRYTNSRGQTSYYDSTGSSTQKAFIRTPVDAARISSRYNPHRKHPVTGRVRPHKGVDYAAPSGTPVKATGNGKVIFAGRKGGYGNTVIIQHGSKYRTLYAHLRGFAKGVRSGSEVKQGQVIAYVGSTGLSTGPHLHYEFLVNGAHVDPLSNTLPAADPIAKSELPRFKQQTGTWLAMLETQNTQVALAPKE